MSPNWLQVSGDYTVTAECHPEYSANRWMGKECSYSQLDTATEQGWDSD